MSIKGSIHLIQRLGRFVPPLDKWLAQLRNNAHWKARLSELPRTRALLLWFLRLGHLLYRGAGERELRGQAAALTFSTLMSLIPLVALSLSLLKGLGFHHQFMDSIQSYLLQLPTDLQSFFRKTLETVEQTDFGKLGGLGAGILLFTAIQVLGRVEIAFNGVWGIEDSRPLIRRFTTQISVIVVVPILLLAALSWYAKVKLTPSLPALFPAGALLQFLGTWLAFSFLYQMMPNTLVKWRPALWAGLFGAILWQLWFKFYLMIQPGVTRYNIIYGTLASIPIFMAWLYMSWLILLIGAKLTYAIQNEKTFELDILAGQANFRDRLIIAFAVLLEAQRAFHGQAENFDFLQFSRKYRVPPRLLEQVINRLIKSKILGTLSGPTTNYVLLRDPSELKLAQIFEIICTQEGCSSLFLMEQSLLEAVSQFEKVGEGIQQIFGEQTLASLSIAPK